jgi:hypothetical protein
MAIIKPGRGAWIEPRHFNSIHTRRLLLQQLQRDFDAASAKKTARDRRPHRAHYTTSRPDATSF